MPHLTDSLSVKDTTCGTRVALAPELDLDVHLLQEILDAQTFSDTSNLSIQLSFSAAKCYALLNAEVKAEDMVAQQDDRPTR